VLTFFLDEQTGKAGMTTRLEAFVDLMKRKKLLRKTCKILRPASAL
jgi:predicted nucleotide-binding protein (sugar kinase/HSP70/actin superfamily)